MPPHLHALRLRVSRAQDGATLGCADCPHAAAAAAAAATPQAPLPPRAAAWQQGGGGLLGSCIIVACGAKQAKGPAQQEQQEQQQAADATASNSVCFNLLLEPVHNQLFAQKVRPTYGVLSHHHPLLALNTFCSNRLWTLLLQGKRSRLCKGQAQ